MEQQKDYSERTAIITRFVKALDLLIERGEYKSYYHYAQAHGFFLKGIMRVVNEPVEKYGSFRVEWVAPMVRNHGLNGNWFFTGTGLPYPSVKKQAKAAAIKNY